MSDIYAHAHLPSRHAVFRSAEPERDEMGQFVGGYAGKTWRDVFNEERLAWDPEYSTGRDRRAFFGLEHELGGRAAYDWSKKSEYSTPDRSEEDEVAVAVDERTVDPKVVKKCETVLRAQVQKLGEQRDGAEGDDLRSVEILIAESEAALTRIADGTYGFCTSCNEPISEVRLETLPHVGTCVKCVKARSNGTGTPAPAGTAEKPKVATPATPAPAKESGGAATPPVSAEPTSVPRAAGATTVAVDLIDPAADNPREDLGDIQGLADSIRHNDLYQRLIVEPKNDGRYELVDGHRRLAAVKLIGWDLVPVDVRLAGAATDNEKARLITAIQRMDLSPLEEARGLKRLVDQHGMTQRDLASQLGISQPVISKRLALLDLPKTAIKAVDSGRITLGDAEHLTKVKDAPEVVEAAVKEAAKYPNQDMKWIVDRTEREHKREAKQKAAIEKLKAAGVTIVKDRYSSKNVRLGKNYGELNVDKRKHADEPCHAAYIDDYSGDPIYLCTDRTRHSAKGKSKLKGKVVGASTSSMRGPSAKEKAEKERKKQLTAAAKSRLEFVKERLGKKRVAKDLVIELVTVPLLTEGRYGARAIVEAADLCNFLGIETPGKGPSKLDDEADVLAKLVKKDPAVTVDLALAMAVVNIERRVTPDTYYVPDSYVPYRPYFDLLEKWGYELTDAERQMFDVAGAESK